MLIGRSVVQCCPLRDAMHSLADVQLNDHIVNRSHHSQMPSSVFYSVMTVCY